MHFISLQLTTLLSCFYIFGSNALKLVLQDVDDVPNRFRLQQEGPDVLGTYVLEGCTFDVPTQPGLETVEGFGSGSGEGFFPLIQGIVTITPEWVHGNCRLQSMGDRKGLVHGGMIAKWTLDGNDWNINMQYLSLGGGYLNTTSNLYVGGNFYRRMYEFFLLIDI